MKAKLSFLAPLMNRGLAMPSCFGLVITLVLAACGGDSPTKPDQGSGGNSSAGGVQPPKDAGDVKIDGFAITPYEKKVVIDGTVYATIDNPIVKVTFSIPGGNNSWIKYQRETLPSNGVVNVNEQKTFDLNDAEIDLRQEDIPCGTPITVNVEVRSKLDSVARNGGTFTKPCALTPSSVVEVSSSSVASWVFGAPTPGEAYGDIAYPIGSGQFTLLSGEGGTDVVDQPDLKITGGKIKLATPCNEQRGSSAGPEGDVYPGEPYSSKENCLGNTPATDEKLSQVGGEGLGVQQGDYYLIYLDDNSNSVYLIFFTKKEGQSFTRWPIKYIYWPATGKP